MKPLLRFGLTALTAALVGTMNGMRPVNAATFGQQEVDQSKLIAIAAPRGNTGAYQLLILEQTSTQRPCWAESGSNPIRVDPLLLTFNFTGICDRKTDSNGFSIRMAGEDLALNYNLRVVRTDQDLVLIGYPSRDRNAPILEIGRAYGVIPGEFAKLILNPNWRFTKRTYEGRTLGHVYLTTDASLADVAATTAAPDLTPLRRTPDLETRPAVLPETPVPSVTEGKTGPAGTPVTSIEVETSVAPPVESSTLPPTSIRPGDPLPTPKSDQELVVPTREALPTLW